MRRAVIVGAVVIGAFALLPLATWATETNPQVKNYCLVEYPNVSLDGDIVPKICDQGEFPDGFVYPGGDSVTVVIEDDMDWEIGGFYWFQDWFGTIREEGTFCRSITTSPVYEYLTVARDDPEGISKCTGQAGVSTSGTITATWFEG